MANGRREVMGSAYGGTGIVTILAAPRRSSLKSWPHLQLGWRSSPFVPRRLRYRPPHSRSIRSCATMADEEGAGLRDRLSRQGEEALGKLASDLLENPLINSALTRAFSARERAVHAQEAAMGALNLPSAADIDRLTRRLRTVSTRLEGIEDSIDRLQLGLDRLAAKLESVPRRAGLVDRLDTLDGQISKLVEEVTQPAPVPREQERLAVDAAAAASKRTPQKK